MPINLPQARRRLEEIRSACQNGLDVDSSSDKDYYLRDIEVYAIQLAMSIQVTAEEPVADEPASPVVAEAGIDDAMALAQSREATQAALNAFRAATLAPEASTATSQPFYWRAQSAGIPQVIRWGTDETLEGLQVDGASIDEPVEPAEEVGF